jgi:excisionase family DNA binding protein
MRGAAGSDANTGPDRGHAGFHRTADDLKAAWNAPSVSMRARQRLLRALITDIIADVDEAAREVVLTIHWRGGQHSQLRVRKPKTCAHGCRTPEAALAVMRSMASRWSDEDIATSLNRMGMPTRQGKTWTAHRVSSVRRVNGIHAYRSAEKTGEWLTMTEAAIKLGVTNHKIRRLIKDRVLSAEQVVPGAPCQIRACDLEDERVTAELGRKGRPCRVDLQNQIPMFP